MKRIIKIIIAIVVWFLWFYATTLLVDQQYWCNLLNSFPTDKNVFVNFFLYLKYMLWDKQILTWFLIYLVTTSSFATYFFIKQWENYFDKKFLKTQDAIKNL